MKQINYFLLLFCLLSHTLDTGAAQVIKKISPNKQKDEEPLMHMARSVSSDGPALEGGMRLQRVLISAAVGTIREEDSDRDEDKSKRRLSVEVDVEAPYAIMRTPNAATRTPKQGAFNFNASATGGGLLTAPHARPRPSPRHGGDGVAVAKTPKSAPLTLPSPKSSPKTATSSRRGSRDSSNDDPDIKAAIAAKCSIAGKDTPNTRKHFRTIVKQQQKEKLLVSASVQSIDGETIGDIQYIDTAMLIRDDRSDDFPGERGGILASDASGDDVAKPEWTAPVRLFENTDLIPERRRYLLKLKKAALAYEKILKSYSDLYVGASERDKKTALNEKLIDIAHGFYGGTLTERMNEQYIRTIREAIDRDLKQANELGCCAGCVIL